MINLSENFYDYEFRCHGVDCCGGVYAAQETLLFVLEWLRFEIDQPLNINRGFTCFKHNATIKNAAKDSAHCHAYAADVWSKGITPVGLYGICLANENITGLGVYSTHLHIDTRPGPRRIW